MSEPKPNDEIALPAGAATVALHLRRAGMELLEAATALEGATIVRVVEVEKGRRTRAYNTPTHTRRAPRRCAVEAEGEAFARAAIQPEEPAPLDEVLEDAGHMHGGACVDEAEITEAEDAIDGAEEGDDV